MEGRGDGRISPSNSAKFLTNDGRLPQWRFQRQAAGDLDGVLGKMADTMNDILAVSERRAEEIDRVSRVVGKEGHSGSVVRARASGGWADEIDSLNTLIDDLVLPTTEVTRAIGAVAKGDLSQAMALESTGVRWKENSFAARSWSTG